MTNVMKSAWEIAYEGVEKFGGQVKEYFAAALKIAWNLLKGQNAVKVSTWVTARGSKVEMHTEHVTEVVIGEENSFAGTYTKKVDQIKIIKIVVAGETMTSIQATRSIEQGQRVVHMGAQIINGQKLNALFPLPKAIEEDVWGAYDKREEKRNTVVVKGGIGYCRKHDDFCHGDCSAN